MASRALCVALLLSSLSITGCGTVANLVLVHPAQGGKTPFGGVRHDLACLHPPPASGQCHETETRLFCAADLPFTFIGDVLTWPYTASYTFINGPVPVPPPLPAPFQPIPQMPATGQTQPPLMPATGQAQIPAAGQTQTPAAGRPLTPPLQSLPAPSGLPLGNPGSIVP
jgi:hypothetical protein